jgi:hypothetical protein
MRRRLPRFVSGHDFSRAANISKLDGLQPLEKATPLLLAVLVLMFIAGCTKKELAPSTPHDQTAIISTQTAPGSAFTMSMWMNPAQPRFARKTLFHVTLKQASGAPADGAQVGVSLVMPLMDMGKNQFPLKQVARSEYQGIGEFTMAGEWEVVVSANAQGKTGKTTFNVNVAE